MRPGPLDFELSSGLAITLHGSFLHGIGNRILPPVTPSGLYKINENLCQVKHEAQVDVDLQFRWTGTSVAANPWGGSYPLISPSELVDAKLLMACYPSGGLSGATIACKCHDCLLSSLLSLFFSTSSRSLLSPVLVFGSILV
jgi:hypothetical protein